MFLQFSPLCKNIAFLYDNENREMQVENKTISAHEQVLLNIGWRRHVP